MLRNMYNMYCSLEYTIMANLWGFINSMGNVENALFVIIQILGK